MESSGERFNSESNYKPNSESSQANHIDPDHVWRTIKQQLSNGVEHPSLTINGLFSLLETIIRNKENQGRGTSWHPDFVQVSKDYVSTWDDFNEENVDTIFGDFLDEKTYEFSEPNLMSIYYGCRQTDSDKVTRLGFTIHSENDLQHMYTKLVVDVFRDSVGNTAPELQERVNERPPVKLHTGYESQGIYVVRHNLQGQISEKFPDWPFHALADYGIRRSPRVRDLQVKKRLTEMVRRAGQKSLCLGPSDQPGETISFVDDGKGIFVVGEAKRKKVFNPANLVSKRKDWLEGIRNTLGQVMMYCIGGGTRYAHVFTSEEVTVMRFFEVDTGRRFGMHYAILPWEKKPGRMSAWKGIWALTMLSLHDKHRRVVKKAEVRDLNDWARLVENGKVLWANHLSKIIIEGDSERTKNFRVVDAPREEFAKQLDQHHQRQSA